MKVAGETWQRSQRTSPAAGSYIQPCHGWIARICQVWTVTIEKLAMHANSGSSWMFFRHPSSTDLRSVVNLTAKRPLYKIQLGQWSKEPRVLELFFNYSKVIMRAKCALIVQLELNWNQCFRGKKTNVCPHNCRVFIRHWRTENSPATAATVTAFSA